MWSNPVTETPLTVTSRDGTTLHARWWTESWAPRAVVLVVHGIHQSSELYRPEGCSTLAFRLIREAKAAHSESTSVSSIIVPSRGVILHDTRL